MHDAAQMFQLQKIDLTQDKVVRGLRQIQKLLGESEDIAAARELIAEKESELHEWRAKQKDAELESRSLAERIKESEDRLMGGSVSNPKELEALQSSVESMRRHRTTREDDAVEAMMHADEIDNELEELQATLTKLESEWSGGQSELKERGTKLKHNYLILKKKREQVTQGMPEDLLRRYENMRKRKAGIAIAELQQETCGACNVQVPTGVVSNVRSSDDRLITCPSCGRYLYSG